MAKVTLRKRKLPSGITSLFIDYTYNGKRERMSLEMYLFPKGHKSYNSNRETLLIAESIRAKKDNEIKSGNFGIIAPHIRKLDFFIYLEHFVKNYRKADYRMYNAILPAFKKYLGADTIFCSNITPELMQGFYNYLYDTYNGETPFNYFSCIRRILKAATKDGLFLTNPSLDVKVKRRINQLTKQVLLEEEIKILSQAHCGNAEVKRAFLFATQTGLRKIDIKLLKWKQIYLDLGYIDFVQSKTERRNLIPLNNKAIEILGEPGKGEEYVFNLNISDMALRKNLKVWMKRAGIKKHITFHCARHSCITNILIATDNLVAAQEIAGHSSTKMTEKYTHISDAFKKKTISSIGNW